MNILNTALEDELSTFLKRCAALGIENTAGIRAAAVQSMRFYNGQEPSDYPELVDLFNRWYVSLENGKPDYSVYAPDIYLAHVFACWRAYSRKTILDLCNPKLCPPNGVIPTLPKGIRIADLGCGLGYTSAALKQLMPESVVIGTNLPNTTQRRFADKIASEFGFTLMDSLAGTGQKVDIIFASEYFEHVEDPLEHLRQLCDENNPRMFIMANAFGATSLGHFNTYRCFGQAVSNKEIGKPFAKYLRQRGYEKVATKFWNSRPAIYQKKS